MDWRALHAETVLFVATAGGMVLLGLAVGGAVLGLDWLWRRWRERRRRAAEPEPTSERIDGF